MAATVAGVTVSYTYNHLDQRVTKTLNGHTRLLVYDTAGNLIEELDAATGDVLAGTSGSMGHPWALFSQDRPTKSTSITGHPEGTDRRQRPSRLEGELQPVR